MKRILVLQELSAYLEKDRSTFHRAGFALVTGASNEELLEMHTTEQTDLIITKLALPGLCGDRLCSHIRRDSRLSNVSIILVCENNQEEKSRSRHCGANAVLSSPVAPEDLLGQAMKFLAISKRESFRVLARVQVTGRFNDKSFLCSTVNISSSGLLLETDRQLTVGDAITCSFFLPGSKQLELRGNVVRGSRKNDNLHEYGIKFLPLDYEIRGALKAFILSKSGTR